MRQPRIGVPPRWVRVFVLTPVTFVGAAAVTVASPLLHLLLLLIDLLDPRGRDARGQRRWRFSRIGGLAIALCVTEAVGLTALFVLWLASGLGWRLRSPTFVRVHNRMFGLWLELVTRALRAFLGFTFELPRTERVEGPVLTFARHAGPGDAFLLARTVIVDFRRQLRMLGTHTLLWDPFMSYLLGRLPFHVCDPNPRDPWEALTGITRMCETTDDDSVVIIFPEGGNWTPNRWTAGIERLRARGRHDLADRAAAMPHLLPPRSAGARAALLARPDLAVVFVVHTGLEDLYSAAEIWRKVPLRRTVRAAYWSVPRHDVEAAIAEGRLSDWFFDQWVRIHDWILRQPVA